MYTCGYCGQWMDKADRFVDIHEGATSPAFKDAKVAPDVWKHSGIYATHSRCDDNWMERIDNPLHHRPVQWPPTEPKP